jgi:hypothetical protein
MEQQNAAGKKIFFLYPHSVIHGEVFDILIMNGYEAYSLWDYKRARSLLERFPDSIMFINIDERLTEQEWETYVRELQKDPKIPDCRLGILSYNTDPKLMEKYLMDMAIPCGYIQLKLGVQASTRIILDALAANEARGRRKFIRAFCEADRNVTLNYRNDLGTFYGKLLDISSAGCAARMETSQEFAPNMKLENVQLKLRGHLVMLDAVLMGKRQGDPRVWIILFDPNNMRKDDKMVIHHFIKETIQRYIDTLEV